MSKYDWKLIKLDYETGVISIRELCRKHGLTPTRLYDEARAYGWVRRTPPEDLERRAHIQASGRSAQFDLKELEENAVLTATHVVTVHRKDAARIRSISNTIIERLSLYLNGEEVSLPFIGPRETPADLLEKLSRVHVRMTALERQAFGLDTFDPDSAAKEGEVEKTAEELWEMVHQLQSDKAANR